MKIICLGSNGYFPTDDMETTCFMIPELGIIIDAGTGLFRALRYIQTEDLHIFLTHCHSDHITGLSYLNAFYESAKIKNIYIHASQFTLDFLQNMFKPPYTGSYMKFIPCLFNTDETSILENVTVKRFPVNHSIECYGYLFTISNHKLAFITDTFSDGSSNYAKIVTKSDLLFHECYLSNEMENTKHAHTSSSGLIEFCKSAEITNVCFMHHNPQGNKEKIFDEIRQSIPTIKMAKDLESYEF